MAFAPATVERRKRGMLSCKVAETFLLNENRRNDDQHYRHDLLANVICHFSSSSLWLTTFLFSHCLETGHAFFQFALAQPEKDHWRDDQHVHQTRHHSAEHRRGQRLYHFRAGARAPHDWE